MIVEDKGGGIPLNKSNQVFDFFHSSSARTDMTTYQGLRSSPMAGYGFGLGLARIYCQYFGGDLQLESCEGLGTSATVSLVPHPHLAMEDLTDVY